MQDSDQDAFDAFCRREWPRLVASLSYIVGDRCTGEELAQEALIRACQHWDRVGSLESPGGWVHRVGVNLASSHRRRLRVRPHLSIDSSQAPTQDVDEAVDVRRAVLELPLSQRQAIVLRYVVGMSVAEAADAMNITPEAVRVRTHRASETLRRRLS